MTQTDFLFKAHFYYVIFPAVAAVYTQKLFPKLCNEAFSERLIFPFKLFSKENCKGIVLKELYLFYHFKT